MTKVVTYLFDSMFQGKQKVSTGEKAFVITAVAIVLTTSILFVL